MSETYTIIYKYKNEIIKINCDIKLDTNYKNWYSYTAFFVNKVTNITISFDGRIHAINIEKAKNKLYTIIDDYFDDDGAI